ncbi:MAG: dihydroxy-acid dehydratase [Proteobacteria bacterium]|nr:dihydroxy-acid dehydratase [Pseudomonadota bacterium]
MAAESPPRKAWRSRRWFGARDLRAFGHRSRLKQAGFTEADYAEKPVIAVINTWSDMNPCHAHLRQRAEEVKRGVFQAGGFPVELPAMSLGEIMVKPTTMLYRNLLAMEAEELLRSHPVDGAVLLGGCDKTTPALIMGALSMNLPAIFVPAGPMLIGRWRGAALGSGSDTWKYWAELRAGNITEADWTEIEGAIARSPGICMTMGTASTMTVVAEAMGFTLPGAASIPAVDSGHARMASESGRAAVELVRRGLRPSDILSEAAIHNGIVAAMALGGSTNAVIHLLALARRVGVPLSLDRFDAVSRLTPVIADLRPSGRWLMEDFHYAGGSRAFLARLAPLLHLGCLTANGRTLGDNLEGAVVASDEVIRPLETPLSGEGGIAILRGSLAPDGAVIKPTAAGARFLRHRGRAVVFADYNDMAARIDDEALEVDETSVLVLRNAGPLGGPGMPEWGMLPIPRKLLRRGVRDMVRVSDARMSGTSYGTCVLHVAPESFVGGPLALVESGDTIALDVPGRRLDLVVEEAELARRRARWTPPPPRYGRGYGALFSRHVTQANEGCDFDFLHTDAGPPVPEPEIH